MNNFVSGKGQQGSKHFLSGARKIKRNLTTVELVEEALVHKEGIIAHNGALRVTTGKYTGRSPKDKFIVDTAAVHDKISWTNNAPCSETTYNSLYQTMCEYVRDHQVYVGDGFAGADPDHRLQIRFITEFAWQNLFLQQLFIKAKPEELKEVEDFTVICLPGVQAVPEVNGTNSECFIIINFDTKMVLIGGNRYAGEMKKSIFSVMNYILPQKGILTMHCSANVGKDGKSALFFGLSGTGKTTLSADPNRYLVGDDEHGWSENGIFNIEGGCYAKCIRLTESTEPQIWNAIKFTTVLENVVLDPQTRVPDYDDASLTENTRTAYPLEFIPGSIIPSIANHPTAVIFLTADAFGVLPPIAKLTKEQAMYHFLSGYTSKVAGTERGITEPQATFSTCFGEPFLPLSPLKYARLLGEKIEEHNTDVFLINTGWTGGPYGIGKRMNLKYTRAMVTAALDGHLNSVEWETDPIFNLAIPKYCPDVPSSLLNPRNTWEDKEAYERQALKLAELFNKNVQKFKGEMTDEILNAGPAHA